MNRCCAHMAADDVSKRIGHTPPPPAAAAVVGAYVALRFCNNFPLCVAYTLLLCWGLWQHVAPPPVPPPLLLFLLRGCSLLSCFFLCFRYCCCCCCFVCRHHQRAAGTPTDNPPPPLSRCHPCPCVARFFLLHVSALAFWYLTFIWYCHARCWLPAFSPALSTYLPPSHPIPLLSPCPTRALSVLFLPSDYVDCSAVPVDPSLLIVCLTEWLNGERDKRSHNCPRMGRGSNYTPTPPPPSLLPAVLLLPDNPYDLRFYPFI